jgi:exodeoxyribonuclease V alpha subunit
VTNNSTISSRLIKVNRISKQSPEGIVLSGTQVDMDGNVVDVRDIYTVLIPQALASLPVANGCWIDVEGEDGQFENEWIGIRKTIKASRVDVVMPSGEHLVDYLQSRLFPNIGQKKAERLWETFQDSLYEILDRGDTGSLTKVLTPAVAQGLLDAWKELSFVSSQLRWLAGMKIPVKLGTRILRHYMTDLGKRLTDDPYDLLAFSGDWKEVDKIALESFKIRPYDERRMLAATEQALLSDWRNGNTFISISTLEASVRRLIVSEGQYSITALKEQIQTALSLAVERGAVVAYPDTEWCSYLGAAVLEQMVAVDVVNRIRQPEIIDASLNLKIDQFEARNCFSLTPEQRQAVLTSSQNALSLITGGAGVGKTTVLTCLIQVLKSDGWTIKQLALAGKAAKRMVEATGEPASTIASYLTSNKGKEPHEVNLDKTAIIIDECSMVDLVSFGRFLELTEQKVKLILVGDENQIMPVGAGLVLHELVKLKDIKHSKLTVVKRYKSDIGDVANSVLQGKLSTLSDDEKKPVSWLSGTDTACQERAIKLFLQEPSVCQILCETKNAALGTKELNNRVQKALTADNPNLTVMSDLFVGVHADTGFNLHDRVICNKNHWSLGLQNGSIGQIVEITDPATRADPFYDDELGQTIYPTIARIAWDDGMTRDLTEKLLPDLSLAYAITIHRSQGSQWENVIIPLSGSQMLDRNVLYTAITRARERVTLLGDFKQTSVRVGDATRASKRRVLLASRIKALLVKQSKKACA